MVVVHLGDGLMGERAEDATGVGHESAVDGDAVASRERVGFRAARWPTLGQGIQPNTDGDWSTTTMQISSSATLQPNTLRNNSPWNQGV